MNRSEFAVVVLILSQSMPKGNKKPKPPKKRKSFGRNQRGGNKKNSNYNFNEARQAMAIPKANHAQISQHANVTSTNPPSQKVHSNLYIRPC